MSLPGGLLAKRFGEHRVLASGLLIIALGLACLSVAPNFTLGLSSRVLWLMGYRLSFICVMTAIALTVPHHLRGRAMGILGAFSSLASVIGAPFGVAIRGSFGWRGGIAAFGIMALLGAASFWIFYRRDPEAAPAPNRGEASRSALRNPLVWTMVLLGLGNMGGFSATFFVPSAARTVFQMDAAGAASIISSAYLAAIVFNLITGYLADRFNRWWVMAGLLALIVPACFAMMSTNLAVFWTATALVISLGLAFTNQIYPLAGEIMAGRETGPVMGIVSLGGGVFGFLGPQMLGYLRERTGDFVAGWYFVAAGACIALVVILILKRWNESTRPPAASAAR